MKKSFLHFMRGAGSVMDIYPFRSPVVRRLKRRHNTRQRYAIVVGGDVVFVGGAEASGEALRSDWEKVGIDMNYAMTCIDHHGAKAK